MGKLSGNDLTRHPALGLAQTTGKNRHEKSLFGGGGRRTNPFPEQAICLHCGGSKIQPSRMDYSGSSMFPVSSPLFRCTSNWLLFGSYRVGPERHAHPARHRPSFLQLDKWSDYCRAIGEHLTSELLTYL